MKFKPKSRTQKPKSELRAYIILKRVSATDAAHAARLDRRTPSLEIYPEKSPPTPLCDVIGFRCDE